MQVYVQSTETRIIEIFYPLNS